MAVYIHWPYCLAKCPYCDFNSHVRHRPVDQEDFSNLLIDEMRSYQKRWPERRVGSVFFGGGTPSLMEARHVGRLLDALNQLWPLENNCEITLEANPTSVEMARFKGYRAAGVNRVSIGVQALNDDALRFLGRQHSAADALNAVRIAKNIFERYSFDLIYARPHQSWPDWQAELTKALAWEPGHLSLYQLTMEPGTRFFALWEKGRLAMPDEERAAELYERTEILCQEHGLHGYEISNYALSGQESRHNLVYWRCGDYLGIGPGAHGRITEGTRRLAMKNIAMPEDWRAAITQSGSGLEACQTLPLDQQRDEFLLMGLRLKEGINREEFTTRFGTALPPSAVDTLCQLNLAEQDEKHFRVTAAGRLLLNKIVESLSSDGEKSDKYPDV